MRARTVALVGAGVIALVAATAAYGATTYTLTAKATANKAGSKAKPAPFTGTFTYKSAGSGGERSASPRNLSWSWNGVVMSPAGFPTCTADQIDAAQSDAACPKGSLVAEGPVEAVLGPQNDKTSKINCTGKDIRLYNNGGNKLALLIVGPPTNCAGVSYLAPSIVTMKTSGGSTRLTWVLPGNIIEPLPGLEGGIQLLSLDFKKVSRKAKGKTVYYTSSTSCKSKRTLSWTTVDTQGTTKLTANAGTCS